MIYRWVGTKVNLSLLVDFVKQFFEGEKFKTRVDELSDGWMILAVKHINGSPKSAFVKVCGRPNDFLVEFSASSQGRKLALLGPMITFFGLGVIVKSETKWIEVLENLEKRFWVSIEGAVSDLRSSEKDN
jgi:hypothetical protein